ncbi:hypothetical protein C8R46DRAFT_1032334 [Mycena filopes]|nr:hypothetical protein C8R46DRAFT_1032334 [Mycena filopes]
MSTQPSTLTPPSTSTSDVHTLTDWPNFCVFCGFAPIVAPRYTAELRRLFSGSGPAVLAMMGILHDLHLRILATRTTPERRRAFLLEAVKTGRCTQLEVLQMASALESFAKTITERGEKLPGGDMEVCARHSDQHDVAVSPELAHVLQGLGMEELGPAAVFLGIDSDARFRVQTILFDNMKGIQPSPFQKLMLKIALKKSV